MMSDVDLPAAHIRNQVASAIDVVVHLARLRDGRRVVWEIASVEGTHRGEPVVAPLFRFRPREGQLGGVRGDGHGAPDRFRARRSRRGRRRLAVRARGRRLSGLIVGGCWASRSGSAERAVQGRCDAGARCRRWPARPVHDPDGRTRKRPGRGRWPSSSAWGVSSSPVRSSGVVATASMRGGVGTCADVVGQRGSSPNATSSSPTRFGPIASALRAGMSVPQALAYAREESDPPLRPPGPRWWTALELGVPFEDALDGGRATSAPTTRAWSPACCGSIAGAGATCPPSLDQVAGTLRERRAAAREVRALTAQARLSGAILGFLPIGFFAFLWLTSRSEIEGAFRTPAGLAAIGLGLGARRPGVPVDPSAPGGPMSVTWPSRLPLPLRVRRLVASARSLLVGRRPRTGSPSMAGSPSAAAATARSGRSPRWIWIAGGCLVVLPVVALPFPAPLLVLVPCLRRLSPPPSSPRTRRDRRRPARSTPRSRSCSISWRRDRPPGSPLHSRSVAPPTVCGARSSDELAQTLDAVDLGARWREELRALPTVSICRTCVAPSSVLTRTETLGSSLSESRPRSSPRRSAGAASGGHRAGARGAGEDALPAWCSSSSPRSSSSRWCRCCSPPCSPSAERRR